MAYELDYEKEKVLAQAGGYKIINWNLFKAMRKREDLLEIVCVVAFWLCCGFFAVLGFVGGYSSGEQALIKTIKTLAGV